MYNCSSYGCDPLETYVLNECQAILVGGFDAAILLECNHQITDPSNATQIETALGNGTATLITEAFFSIEPAAAVTVEPLVACQPPKITTYNRSGNYKNQNVNPNNVDFHDTMFNGRTFGGLIIRMCNDNEGGTNYVYWIDKPISFQGSFVGPGVNTDLQRFEGTFNWIGRDNPSMHAEPAGIFD